MAYFQMFSLTLCMLGNLSCICCCQRFSFFKINLFVCSIALLPVDIITCAARGVELRHFSIQNALMVSESCNL